MHTHIDGDHFYHDITDVDMLEGFIIHTHTYILTYLHTYITYIHTYILTYVYMHVDDDHFYNDITDVDL